MSIRITAAAFLLSLLSAIGLAEEAIDHASTSQPATAEKLPAEGMELPDRTPTPSLMAVSPNGRFVALSISSPDGQSMTTYLYDAKTGDSIEFSQLKNFVPKEDGELRTARIINVNNAGQAVLYVAFMPNILPPPNQQGPPVDPRHKTTKIIDIPSKSVLSVPALDKYDNAAASAAIYHDDKWSISFSNADYNGTLTVNTLIVDPQKGTAEELPFNTACVGIMNDGSMLLIGPSSPARKNAADQQTKPMFSFWRSGPDGNSPPLRTCDNMRELMYNPLRFSPDGRLFVEIDQNDQDQTKPAILRVFELVGENAEPVLKREHSLTKPENRWEALAVSKNGCIILRSYLRASRENPRPKISFYRMTSDGQITLCGETKNDFRHPYPQGRVSAPRVWYQLGGEGDNPPTLHSISVEEEAATSNKATGE